MDLRQLNHLIAVVEHRSFSAAARALHTVQSNVSTHVAKLEKELGAVLVDRHTMQPTSEGKAVLERARRIRTELQAIRDDIVSMRHEVAGEVRIGCIGTTGRWMATPLLRRLAARHPALHPVLVDATTTSLIPRVMNGDLDMAIVNTPVVEAGLDSEPLFDEERILVVPKGHPLAGQGTIGIEQLAEHPVMLTPRGTTFRDALDQELAASGVRLTSAAEVDGLRLLASLAYQGYGRGLDPALLVDVEHAVRLSIHCGTPRSQSDATNRSAESAEEPSEELPRPRSHRACQRHRRRPGIHPIQRLARA